MSGWRRVLLTTIIAGCTSLVGAPRADEIRREPPPHAAVQHALGILEYVGGDYEGAVDAEGRIRHDAEYAEQQDLLRRADKLLTQSVGSDHRSLVAEMRGVRAACAARVAPSVFVPRVRRLHTRIVRELHVELTPRFVPSLAVGKIVYAQSCAVCHGDDGSATTPQAAALDPRPLDFRHPDVVGRLSPYLAFTMVTFGVPGTAMASFEALPEDERWAVAFYVLALRHTNPGAGAHVAPAVAGPWRPTLRDLALATDPALAIRAADLPAEQREGAIARWRWSLPLELGH